MGNIPTTTIRVSKEVLESIKIYSRKHGKNVGEWVEAAWDFIQRNDFDIYDKECTPYLPVPNEPQNNEVKALCTLMAEFIAVQKQLPSSDNHDLKDVLQQQMAENEQLRRNLREADRQLELAKVELRRLRKGIFNTPDEGVLNDLGIY